MTSKSKTVSLRVPDEVYGFLKVLANSENRSLSKQILTIIEEWVVIKKAEEEIANTPTKEGTFIDVFPDWSQHPVTGSNKWIYSSPKDSNITWNSGAFSGEIAVLDWERSIDATGNTTYSISFAPNTPSNDQLISNVIKSNEYDIRLMFKKKEEDND